MNLMRELSIADEVVSILRFVLGQTTEVCRSVICQELPLNPIIRAFC